MTGLVEAGLGGGAIKELLAEIDLEKLARETAHRRYRQTQGPKRARAIKRLEVAEAFISSKSRPEWMILDCSPGHLAGAAADGPARRRPVRHIRPERSLPAHHQPQQPAEEDHRDPRAGIDHQPREAAAAGSRRCADRQRPAHAAGRRLEQQAAEVALRHAQGQGRPVPQEPARQARRLLRPFGHRRRSVAQAAPVRPAQGDGARALQAVRDEDAGREAVHLATSRRPSA